MVLSVLLTLIRTNGFEELTAKAGHRRILRVSRVVKVEIFAVHGLKVSIRDVSKIIGSVSGITGKYVSDNGKKYRATLVSEHAIASIEKRLENVQLTVV
jgi:hypothetical protein